MKRAAIDGWRSLALATGLLLCAAPRAAALEYHDGRLQIHGFGEMQVRSIARDFQPTDGWDLVQWYNVLNTEIEYDLAPDGLGPFAFLSAYARVEVRYDCVWTRACGLFPSADAFGDRAGKLPGRLSDRQSIEGEFVGTARVMEHTGDLVLPDHRPGTVATSPLGPLAEAPVPEAQTALLFDRFEDFRFAQIELGGPIDGHGEDVLGPFLPENFVQPLGVWKDVPNPLDPTAINPVFGTPGTGELPFRRAPAIPAGSSQANDVAQGLWLPDANLRDVMGDFDGTAHDQNFREAELQWNRGASQQDEKELKELYVDLELLDGVLWGRIGKQTIVWGKTELFRNQDQFNPQDLALANLPSLEESRIALWAGRFVYSFYQRGPFDDVRLEAAVNFDQFEPADIGDCGEPFTPDQVCFLKAQALFAHGTTGLGLAGEQRPPNPWDDVEGLEGGLRLEFRWQRFTFAITDFYGFNDFTTAVKFTNFERNVDPLSGRPRAIEERRPCVTGSEPACLRPGETGPNNALEHHPANQTLHAVVCAATVGVIAPGDPTCLTTLPNTGLRPFLNGELASGGANGVALNADVADDPIAGQPLSSVLSDEQEALLGCGPFYQTSCDEDGIDLLNAEASALFQSWLGFEGTPLRPAPGEVWTPAAQAAFLADPTRPNPGTLDFEGGPVATRLVGPLEGQRFRQLLGARSPFDHPGKRFFDESPWSAAVDGCPAPTRPDGSAIPGCAGASALTHPLSGEQFRSEMAALSWNFLQAAVTISQLGGDDPSICSPESPLQCQLVDGLLSLTGIQNRFVSSRSRLFGRRDFIWHGGAPSLIRYDKNNILGVSADFAEDWSKTNWGIEFTWVNDVRQNDAEAFEGTTPVDEFNLTISTDRPTIISFLNGNRSFFINQQTFLGFVKGYQDSFRTTGPIRVLSTLTIFTGYLQDRLNPSVTFVWEWETDSGAVLASIDYRYTEKLRAVFGVNAFAGSVDEDPLDVTAPSLDNRVGGDRFKRFSLDGISAARGRDEVFLRLRYTF